MEIDLDYVRVHVYVSVRGRAFNTDGKMNKNRVRNVIFHYFVQSLTILSVQYNSLLRFFPNHTVHQLMSSLSKM